jgi:hypothetical protein
MRWTKQKLKTYILDYINQKSSLTINEGQTSKNSQFVIDIISEKISLNHNVWQQDTIINNIFFNGGLCLDGVFSGIATGVSNPNCFSSKLSKSQIYEDLILSFPNQYVENLTEHMKIFLKSVTNGFSKTYNEWLENLILQRIFTDSGFVTCTILTPVGTFTGTAFASTLSDSVSIKITSNNLYENIKNELTYLLTQKDQVLTTHLDDYVKSISEGIVAMQEEWLLNTKIQNIQVNGIATYLSPLINVYGSLGKII